MKFYIIILFSFVITSSFVYQTAEPSFVIHFLKKNAHIEIDAFGNIYEMNQNEVIKYNSLGVLQKKFSTKRYGTIDVLDVTNPLKILAYYKDFQQIIFLDNQLTATSNMISLESMGYEQTNVICSSSNNSFWIFDKQNNELLRFNADLKPLVKTGNLKRILDININPTFIQEHNNYVYLNCPNEGILVFDIYGTYYKTVPIKQLKEFRIINGDIFYYQNNTLKQYQPSTFNTIEKPFPDTLIKTVYWQNNKFYKLYSDSLIVQ